MRHAEAATDVALRVTSLLRSNHHNASSINARNASNNRAVITGASITTQLNKVGVQRLKELCGAWSLRISGTAHVTPRLLLLKVRPELWCKVSITLVLKNLIGTIRHARCGIGNWGENAADHRASTLRHAAHHATNQSNARNVDLLIERNGWSRKWLQQAECSNYPWPQVAARNDRINETGLQQKL
jgi:hypothetical protein